MNLLAFALLIIFGFVAGSISYAALMKKQFERFYRFANTGDPCRYRLNGKKYRGTIHTYEPDHMYSYVLDDTKVVHRVLSNEICPILTFNYRNHGIY